MNMSGYLVGFAFIYGPLLGIWYWCWYVAKWEDLEARAICRALVTGALALACMITGLWIMP